MKIKIKIILSGILLMVNASNVFPQDWEKVKPDKLFAVDKNKNFTNINVGIRTNNPLYPLEVRGKIFTDSLQVLKQIEIGNSIIIGY